MRFCLRTLIPRFSIRDLLWLIALVAVVAVWRGDLVRQEAVYQDMIATRFVNHGELRDIARKASHNPELLAELKRVGAREAKIIKSTMPEKRELHRQYMALEEMARRIPERKTVNSPATSLEP